jgi:hypothetical protein
VARKRIGRFDHVIVYTDENQIIELHEVSNGWGGGRPALRPGMTLICGALY